MNEIDFLWAWGAAGAIMWGGGKFSLQWWSDPSRDSAQDKRQKRMALFSLALAVLTGAAFAQAFAQTAVDIAAHFVHLPLTGSALIVGCSANFLWPKIVRKLGDAVDGYKPPASPGDQP